MRINVVSFLCNILFSVVGCPISKVALLISNNYGFLFNDSGLRNNAFVPRRHPSKSARMLTRESASTRTASKVRRVLIIVAFGWIAGGNHGCKSVEDYVRVHMSLQCVTKANRPDDDFCEWTCDCKTFAGEYIFFSLLAPELTYGSQMRSNVAATRWHCTLTA
jgi:hypothetical protein